MNERVNEQTKKIFKIPFDKEFFFFMADVFNFGHRKKGCDGEPL